MVDLNPDNQVAILVSVDSANALSYMPVSDKVNDLNVEPDFVPAEDASLAKYKVLLVPPLYSASDTVLSAFQIT